MFSEEVSLTFPEKDKINTTKQASHPSSTMSASDEEEEYLKEENEEGHIIYLFTSLGPVWSISALAANDAKVDAILSWDNRKRYGPCFSSRQ